MTFREYLSIPYLLVIEAIYHPEGGWIRKAAYPEIPGCAVESFSPLEAIDHLEKLKIKIISTKLCNGEPITHSREPLNNVIQEVELKRWGFSELIHLLDQDEMELKGKNLTCQD